MLNSNIVTYTNKLGYTIMYRFYGNNLIAEIVVALPVHNYVSYFSVVQNLGIRVLLFLCNYDF
jgi:hypothetical protein